MKSIRHVKGDGTIVWSNEIGQFHREDGPAVEYYNGSKLWYVNGRPHRVDGPAVMWACFPSEWWVNGFRITNQIHDWAAEMGIDLKNLTEDDKLIIELKWANYTTTEFL